MILLIKYVNKTTSRFCSIPHRTIRYYDGTYRYASYSNILRELKMLKIFPGMTDLLPN